MDVVGIVEKIVRLGLTIKEAVDTVRRNEECREITELVLRVGKILSPLQQQEEEETGTMNDSAAMSGALEDLEKTLRRAHTLVEACQEKSTVCLFCTAGKQSTQLRRAQERIEQKVMVVVFAISIDAKLTVMRTRPNRPFPKMMSRRNSIRTGRSEFDHPRNSIRRKRYKSRRRQAAGAGRSDDFSINMVSQWRRWWR